MLLLFSDYNLSGMGDGIVSLLWLVATLLFLLCAAANFVSVLYWRAAKAGNTSPALQIGAIILSLIGVLLGILTVDGWVVQFSDLSMSEILALCFALFCFLPLGFTIAGMLQKKPFPPA